MVTPTHLRLRVGMYRGLRQRGWTRRGAVHYATRNPRSFVVLDEAIMTLKARS